MTCSRASSASASGCRTSRYSKLVAVISAPAAQPTPCTRSFLKRRALSRIWLSHVVPERGTPKIAILSMIKPTHIYSVTCVTDFGN